jgi:flagellar FliL protein
MSRIEDAIEKANRLRQRGADGQATEPALAVSASQPRAATPRGYGIGIAVFLLVGFGMYLYAENGRISSAVKPVAVAAAGTTPRTAQHPAADRSALRKNRLPSAVPVDAPDAAYASSHPGWQSYKTASLEFRVFREKGAVKAVQVLSLQQKAITPEFFASFLGEMAGNSAFKRQSGEEKGGYYLEKGKAGTAAEVVVYRKEAGGEIKALVVAYL